MTSERICGDTKLEWAVIPELKDATMLNSERFLNAFSSIEQHLCAALGRDEGKCGFPDLVQMAINQNIETLSAIGPGIEDFKHDLLKFGKLRNAIVHDRPKGHVIAEPNDWAVTRIETIADLLVSPPKVIPLFEANVLMVPVEGPVSIAVQFMASRSYSQIPVYQEDKFVALLTANTIARWLGEGHCIGAVDLSREPLVDVIRHSESQDNYRFLGASSTVFQALSLFEAYERKGKDLDAILITETGEPSIQLLGIITNWDVPRAHKAIQLRTKGLQSTSRWEIH